MSSLEGHGTWQWLRVEEKDDEEIRGFRIRGKSSVKETDTEWKSCAFVISEEAKSPGQPSKTCSRPKLAPFQLMNEDS